ncbi:DUF4097 family beta strand repeat-containing protein [Marinicella sp. W31]|uniref:DUF4097 family beta strand repeat-containing protein n=1 Tax=Marinicella sp. W31 TaxID=3023713 RepID=UPI003757FAB8
MNSKTLKLLFTNLALLATATAYSTTKTHYDKGKLSHEQSINHDLNFASANGNTLFVHNVFGSVDVEGYDGNDVEIRAQKFIWADSTEALEDGMQEIDLSHYIVDQRMHVYLDSPYTKFDEEKGRYSHHQQRSNHDWPNYEYLINITVRLPRDTNLHVSAINDGDIIVSDVHANKLRVSNINGAIDMVNVSGTTKAHSINKDINISYSKNPDQDSSYETINGDLNINFAQQPNAEITFKTMNGDFFTQYDVQNLGPKMLKTSTKSKRGVKYKFDSENRIKIGQGGTHYTFKTLNGDIYVK